MHHIRHLVLITAAIVALAGVTQASRPNSIDPPESYRWEHAPKHPSLLPFDEVVRTQIFDLLCWEGPTDPAVFDHSQVRNLEFVNKATAKHVLQYRRFRQILPRLVIQGPTFQTFKDAVGYLKGENPTAPGKWMMQVQSWISRNSPFADVQDKMSDWWSPNLSDDGEHKLRNEINQLLALSPKDLDCETFSISYYDSKSVITFYKLKPKLHKIAALHWDLLDCVRLFRTITLPFEFKILPHSFSKTLVEPDSIAGISLSYPALASLEEDKKDELVYSLDLKRHLGGSGITLNPICQMIDTDSTKALYLAKGVYEGQWVGQVVCRCPTIDYVLKMLRTPFANPIVRNSRNPDGWTIYCGSFTAMEGSHTYSHFREKSNNPYKRRKFLEFLEETYTSKPRLIKARLSCFFSTLTLSCEYSCKWGRHDEALIRCTYECEMPQRMRVMFNQFLRPDGQDTTLYHTYPQRFGTLIQSALNENGYSFEELSDGLTFSFIFNMDGDPQFLDDM